MSNYDIECYCNEDQGAGYTYADEHGECGVCSGELDSHEYLEILKEMTIFNKEIDNKKGYERGLYLLNKYGVTYE